MSIYQVSDFHFGRLFIFLISPGSDNNGSWPASHQEPNVRAFLTSLSRSLVGFLWISRTVSPLSFLAFFPFLIVHFCVVHRDHRERNDLRGRHNSQQHSPLRRVPSPGTS